VPVVPIEFVLFALTLLGVAVFHHRTLEVALAGLTAVTIYKLVFSGFATGEGVEGLLTHLSHEWVVLTNLSLLLFGFGVLARHFEESGVPKAFPLLLPDDWKGPFVMLVVIFVLSAFLDNIAAALIGGTMAHAVFARVQLGYVAAIVAAANAGGSGSVVGDTTTTMMWIHHVSPLDVFHAYVAAGVAVLVFGIPASLNQHRHSPLLPDIKATTDFDRTRVGIVAAVLLTAMAVNIVVNVRFPETSNLFPFLGAAVWVALLVTASMRRPDWSVLRTSIRGTTFLVALVLTASLMPVDQLPTPTWQTTFALGFLSAVFDNIPLTALALEQGGYDWGLLAYAVGFGGSMIWFGSSAGVAITNIFPEARSVGRWIREGWHVAAAYVVGFFVFLGVLGWHPR
jgi:Na+/H+ antiporter NhaD/arsenite permease-like protein